MFEFPSFGEILPLLILLLVACAAYLSNLFFKDRTKSRNSSLHGSVGKNISESI